MMEKWWTDVSSVTVSVLSTLINSVCSRHINNTKNLSEIFCVWWCAAGPDIWLSHLFWLLYLIHSVKCISLIVNNVAIRKCIILCLFVKSVVDFPQTLMEFKFPPLLPRRGRQTPRAQPSLVTSTGRESVRLRSTWTHLLLTLACSYLSQCS